MAFTNLYNQEYEAKRNPDIGYRVQILPAQPEQCIDYPYPNILTNQSSFYPLYTMDSSYVFRVDSFGDPPSGGFDGSIVLCDIFGHYYHIPYFYPGE